MKIRVFLAVIPLFFMLSCQDCETCDILVRESFVPFEFRYESALSNSMQQINELETTTTELSAQLSLLEQQFNQLSDSLEAISTAVANGDSTNFSQIEVLNAELVTLNDQFILTEQNLSIAESELERASSQSDALESGITRIDTLFDLTSGRFIIFQDSSTRFRIPLSMQVPETDLRIVMGDLAFEVTLAYELEIFSDDKSRIGYKAKNVSVVRHSFDSVSVDCRGNCLSENGKVVAYY